MATKDKLPSNADIWGEPAPAFIKASPGTIKLIEQQLASPHAGAKPTRKPQTRNGVPFKKQGKRK
jgi:hypothetical protein